MAYQSHNVESVTGSSASLADAAFSLSSSDLLPSSQDLSHNPMHKSAIELAVSPSGSQSLGSSPTSFPTQSLRHARSGSHFPVSQDTDSSSSRYAGVRDEGVSHRGMSGPAGRPMSQDSALRLSGGVPSRTKYSFGLYFPPRTMPTSPHYKAASADNLSRSSAGQQEQILRIAADASGAGSLPEGTGVKDLEPSSRLGTKNSSPYHSYTLSSAGQEWDKGRRGRDGRYYVPVLNQSSFADSKNYASTGRTRMVERPHRASTGSSVSVTAQPGLERSHRASMGSSLQMETRTLDTGSASGHTTFVVRIPVNGSVGSSPQHSYGSSFAVTRSPRHTQIDVQRSSPVQRLQSPDTGQSLEVQPGFAGPLAAADRNRSVWQRKVLFENGKNENTSIKKSPNNHLSELEKLTSQRKFASVATRMASFEKSSDEDTEETQTRESTPQPKSHPAVKVRRLSLEQSSGTETDGTMVAENTREEQVADSSTQDGSEFAAVSVKGSSPIRVYVSPSTQNISSPPVLEVVPVCQSGQQGIPSEIRQPVCLELHSSQQQVQPIHPLQPVQIVQPLKRDSSPMQVSEPLLQSSHSRPSSIHSWPQSEPEWHTHSYEVEYLQPRLSLLDTGGSRPARKPSYLSAINTPSSRYTLTPSPEHDQVDRDDHQASPSRYLPPPGANLSSVMSASDSAVSFGCQDMPQVTSPSLSTSSVDTLSSVILRKKTAAMIEDSTAKLHRRTSYLMATARDRSNNATTTVQGTSFNLTIPEEPPLTPVHRQYSLNKLKSFFGEQTPTILEATERKALESPLPDITREGPMWCKVSVYDGKKCSDRSWKQVWAVLRGHALFLLKDRRETSGQSAFGFEEPPVSIKSCLVEIVHDYSRKRKNVFRLTTYTESVYLLQAEDKGTMMSWIQAIKTNNSPDHDDDGMGSLELIRRKASTQSEQSSVQTSPQAVHRDKEKEKEKEKEKTKKLAALSFKAKLPHSPSVRRKKNEESGSRKGWKGLIMPRSFKKQTNEEGSHGGGAEAESEDLSKFTFGVPLEDCFPSPNNEYVPLIVELCTRIVEARGLEVVGVYRVPGNSVAVGHMQEELNRGIENLNMDNDKWLDVNVVSSLLKAFFRKLPEPLVTTALYDKFIEANRNQNPEKRMLKLKRLLHTLPEQHYETFKHLAEHLSRVAAHGHINKMDARNLAIMFGPTLIRKVEDDTVSLVTDMSDQCRIVESIILHNEWFFSTWTHDHHVPIDNSDTPQPSALDTRVPRDDDEDADSAINTKEIISSIVTAANKKLKLRQQTKSSDSLDLDSTFSQLGSDSTLYSHSGMDASDCSFRERNIDAAVQRATILAKSQSSLSSSRSASEEVLDSRATAPLATSEPDFLDWDERRHFGGRSRHVAEDVLLEHSDEVEVGGWVGRETLDWLKRLEQEARTIRRLEEQRQRDMEKRRRQQQAIERELQRSQRDLEMEDAHTVEDILAWNPQSQDTFMAGATKTSTPLAWIPTSTYQPTTPSRPLQEMAQPSMLSTDVRSVATVIPKSKVESSQRLSGGGGKYFVSVANTRNHNMTHASSVENMLDAVAASHASRTGSLENMLDGHPSHDQQQGVVGKGYNAGGVPRHGSLDSLLDMIDRHEHHQGEAASSDSEDGSDLLTSLTTTFDQKLQVLLNPRYRLTSRHTRASAPNKASGGFGHGDHVGVGQPGIVQGQETLLMEREWSRGREPTFRDPSLHRGPRTDAKVGIASRFEWGPNSIATSASSGLNGAAASRRVQMPDFRNFSSRALRLENNSGSIALTQPRKLPSAESTDGQSAPDALNRPVWTRDTITKSQKMEVNTALARRSREIKSSVIRDAGKVGLQTLGTGQEAVDSNRQQESQASKNFTMALTSSGSGASSSGAGKGKQDIKEDNPASSRARSKRRHTVGGTADLEHFKALVAICGQPSDPRPSAWDQLQPTSKENSNHDRSLLSWMRKERLRGSTPNLANLGCHDPAF
ncbi:uncharacterized protein LOC112563732 isoform X4 [Pomacea canaliculata]|nr:uncharacterized protein LOC112563732 isoform X4 [Pomacea canaliculata]